MTSIAQHLRNEDIYTGSANGVVDIYQSTLPRFETEEIFSGDMLDIEMEDSDGNIQNQALFLVDGCLGVRASHTGGHCGVNDSGCFQVGSLALMHLASASDTLAASTFIG